VLLRRGLQGEPVTSRGDRFRSAARTAIATLPRILASALAVAGLLLLARGCGSSDDASSPTLAGGSAGKAGNAGGGGASGGSGAKPSPRLIAPNAVLAASAPFL
jgi:uncharacterized membrane protein YgcG